MIQKFPLIHFPYVFDIEIAEHPNNQELDTSLFDFDCDDCKINFPVKINNEDTLTFLKPEKYISNYSIYVSTPNGKFLKKIVSGNYPFKSISLLSSVLNFKKIFANGDCFRLMVCAAPDGGTYNVYFSNLLIYNYNFTEENNFNLFEYWDNSENNGQNRYFARLSCTIDGAQSKTDTTEYEDSNGKKILLHKKRRKEFDLQFDFYPESMHDTIKEILMFPNLKINDVPMFESGDYNIDWGNKDENNCAMAKTKVSEQDINKYSFC